MNEIDAVTQLNEDFTNQRQPFDGATLPEQWALDQIDPLHDLRFLSYGVSLDYNRSADQLWDNCVELYESEHGPEVFDPNRVVEDYSPDELAEVFGDIGFRYRNRDAQGWYDNSQILVEDFDGSWWKFVKHSGFDAPRLTRMLDDFGFKYLKGAKLAPFYAKVVDASVVDLERVWQLDIPVDTHIRRLTQDLVHGDMDDDAIRNFWKQYGRSNDIDPMAVDTALWLVGNQWNEWGEDYWEEI